VRLCIYLTFVDELPLRDFDIDLARFAENDVTRGGMERLSKLLWIHCGIQLPNTRRRERLLVRRTGLQQTLFDACVNNCMAFTGVYAEEDVETCFHCGAQRKQEDARGILRARKEFLYIPLLPRLVHQYGVDDRARILQTYCRQFEDAEEDTASLSDWWAGNHFRSLQEDYFLSSRDIAIQICWDGFNVTRKTQYHAAPIIAIILNLPPEIRYRKENILLIAMIPGPQTYKHPDTWLQPFVEEMLLLGSGIEDVYDAYSSEHFTLRVHAVLVAGDGPAISQAIGMKTPGAAIVPCRICKYEGKNSGPSRHYYYPHDADQLKMRTAAGRPMYRDNLRADIEIAAGDPVNPALMTQHGTYGNVLCNH
jgi:hypothetical protein